MIALYLATGVIAQQGGVTPPLGPSYILGGSFLGRKKRKHARQEDEDTKPRALEVVKIGKSPNETITGLVIPKRKSAKAGIDHAQDNFDRSVKAKKKHHAKLILDDEWLLLN